MKTNPYILSLLFVLSGCGSDLYDSDDESTLVRVESKASYGGTVTPSHLDLKSGATGQFQVKSGDGYRVGSVSGCGGALEGDLFTTGPANQACNVVAEFVYDLPVSYLVRSNTIYDHGTVSPSLISVKSGSVAQFEILHIAGYAPSFSGCAGTYAPPYFTTSPITESCELDVSFRATLPNTHVLEVKQSEGGTITPQSISVAHGTQAHFLVEPNPGFSVRFSGCEGELIGSYFVTKENFTPCELKAEFFPTLLNGILVQAKSDAGGSINPEIAYVPIGSSAQFVINPPRGQAPGAVSGCAGRLEGNIFTTVPLQVACDVHVTYQLDTPEAFIVEASAGSGGAITPTYASILKGAVGQFFVSSNSGKAIGRVEAQGCSVEHTGNLISTEPLASDCRIRVEFIDSVAINATTSAGGSISPVRMSPAPGQLVSFSVTPNEGWEIDRVYGCGGTLSGGTFNVTAGNTACEVYAAFKSVDLYTAHAVVMGSGAIIPQVATRKSGETVNFRITPNPGWELNQINGCEGVLSNNNYAVTVTRDCEFIALFHEKLPPQNLRLTVGTADAGIIHNFDAVPGAVGYNVYFSRSLDVSPYKHEGAWKNAPRSGTIYALHPDTTYHYIVTAIFGTGSATFEGQPSPIVTGRSSF